MQKLEFEHKIENLLKKQSEMKNQLSDFQKEIVVREEEISAVEINNVQLKQQLEEYQQAMQQYKNISEVSRSFIFTGAAFYLSSAFFGD